MEVVTYTCNTHHQEIAETCRNQLVKASPYPIVCVSLNKDPQIGDKKETVYGGRSAFTMIRQILNGLEATTSKNVFLCEADVLYHPSHFDFIPLRDDTFYYNVNVWKQRWPENHYVWTDNCQQVSGLCANRELLLDFYRKKLKKMWFEGNDRHYEPGHKQSVGSKKTDTWMAKYPNICIRHGKNMTRSKWKPEDFRNKKYAKGWRTAKKIEGWEGEHVRS